MARRFPRAPDLRRRPATQQPKALLLAVCEGRETEPHYIECVAAAFGNGLVRVLLVTGAGAPMTIVEKAVEEVRRLNQTANSSRDSFDQIFEVWAVFDVDQHPRIPEAKALATREGVKIAISNPCFELWGMLHFECINKPMTRHQAQTSLRKYLPSYHHEKNPRFTFDVLKDKVIAACSNAAKCLNNRATEGDPQGNPSTGFHKFINSIVTNGRVTDQQSKSQSSQLARTSPRVP